MASFITPPPPKTPSKHLLVRRSEDRLEHTLVSLADEPLLLARTSKDKCRIDIYIPTGGDPPVAVGPAFTLLAGSESHRKDSAAAEDSDCQTWTLTSDRCECCQYVPSTRAGCSTGCPDGGCQSMAHKRELAKMWQRRESIGPAKIMCMEIALPEICEDGTPATWCTRNGGARAACSALSFATRRPKWSQRIKSLVLDFYGRCTRASAKNFQLVAEGMQDTKVKEADLLYGKTADDTFVLDYKYPFGMAQAFAIALSTNDWA